MSVPESIVIDGTEYTPTAAHPKPKSERKIVRCSHSGVFFAEVESREAQEVVMLNARRVWHWKGAASLSELAMLGTSAPSQCKFPLAVDRIKVLDAIEILDVTEEAAESLDSVAIWSAQ